MPYGFEGTDTGYIFGSSWNIYNGQFPHRDFIYTRPAVPAYFHTIFLFISETYGYLLDRAFFYIQVFIYSFLGAKMLVENFSITSKDFTYFIAILGALVSIHNYPPMGWNTIDGVFFCVLGIYFIARKETTNWQWFLGCFFLVMGVFSKQSFYFTPIFLGGYLLLLKQYKKLIYFSGFALFWVFVYFVLKFATGSFFPFFEQTFQRTGSGALVSVGIKTYYLALKFNIIYSLAGVFLFWVCYKFLPKKITYLLLNVAIATIFVLQFYYFGEWHTIKYIMQLLFIATAGFCVLKAFRDKRYFLLLLLLGVSWSASISNGYQTPIHFSLPIFFSLYLLVFSKGKFIKPELKMPIIYAFILSVFLGTFYYGYQVLYRDSDRSELKFDMGSVFPQLKGIKSDKDTYGKYHELKQLAPEYPNFTVLPSITLAHYLTTTVNPLGTDWPLDVEINNEGEKLISELEGSKTIVFLENSEFTEEQLEGYIMDDIIKNSWTLIEKTDYFDIYSPPQ
ncbi:hypothetical protein QRD02_12355 [Aequorivita sp. SDUM287046]|uniref:Glycosyltransferase RgtA/B/C/D-like domain-containing protein n=1 Tax=Aequorivita aurantiaca TaxID=3053356 RepID=A0ABT8DJG5_9FLAO|nr:hypothetical protein [Aequorivita aurantiaca]MDN3725173.1 hypothetical protein [Aequorivita aurantiaca]